MLRTMFKNLLIIATTAVVTVPITVIISVPIAIMAVRRADAKAATISANKAICAAKYAELYALAASNYAEKCAVAASNYAGKCATNRKQKTYLQSEVVEID